MTVQIKIREASFQDVKVLCTLLKQLGYPQTLEIVSERLQIYEERQDHFVFVAELKGKIVGFISIAALESFIHQGKKYRITALVVDQEVRGQGVGKTLVDYVEKIAKSNQGKLIELTSGVRRAGMGSHHFYRSLGYENEGYMSKLYLRKEL